MIFDFKHAKTLEGRRAKDFVPNCETLSTSILEKALEVGIGIHNYHLDGGNYTGDDLPPVYGNQYVYSSATIFKRKSSSVTVVLWGSGYHQIQLNNYSTNGWHGWVEFLPLSGGTVKGNLVVDHKASSAVETNIRVKNTLCELLLDVSNGGNMGLWSATHNKWILKTDTNGNTTLDGKPSGTYTGNGSGTYRNIATGGIGNFAVIYSENGTVLLTYSGGVVIKDGNISGFLAGNFRDGVIAISATDVFINASGVTYKYEVH